MFDDLEMYPSTSESSVVETKEDESIDPRDVYDTQDELFEVVGESLTELLKKYSGNDDDDEDDNDEEDED